VFSHQLKRLVNEFTEIIVGIHICLMKDGEDLNGWDYIRQGHDRDFPDLINWDEVEFKDQDFDCWRPKDIGELKTRINNTRWEDKGRYLHLVSLVEDNPDYWIYFSY
jgi:hypothetical protein